MRLWTTNIILYLLLVMLSACNTSGDDDNPEIQQAEQSNEQSDENSENSEEDGGNENEDEQDEDESEPGDEDEVEDEPQGAVLDCTDWQNNHPNWLWCDDFENPGSLANNYQDYKIGEVAGLDISSDDFFAGQASLKQVYQAGQVDAGWISWFFGDALGRDYGQQQDHIYFRWYHKFETGFEGMPPKMARIRRLEPGYVKSNAVHIWVETSSDFLPLVADIFAPDSTQSNETGWFTYTSNFHYSNPGNIGRWICHELEVNNNTPGANNGIVRLWVDNKLVMGHTDADFRGDTDKGFNEIMLDTYWNGGSPKVQSRFFDNFVIATERIGCQDIN